MADKKPARQRDTERALTPATEVRPYHAPLFKGATRLATKWGIPAKVLSLVALGVLALSLISYWFLLLAVVLYPILVVISRDDDRAFRIWGLWMQTTLLARNKRFWGAVSFSPQEYSRRRPWCRRYGA